MSKHLLERIFRRPRRGTKEWWLRIAVTAALLAASLFFLGYVLYRGRETLWKTLREVDGWLLAVAFLLYPLGLVPVSWAWHLLMTRLGGCSDWRANVRLYSLSCLPKRIPSSVWYIASRVVLYRDLGIDSAVTLTATALETAWLVLSGLSVYLLSLPFWRAVGEPVQMEGPLIAVAGVCLVLALTAPLWSPLLLRAVRWLLSRVGVTISVELETRDVLPLLGLSALAWIGGGTVLYVLANAVMPVPPAYLPALIGAWAASGAVSLSAGLLVSGMGLREVTLTVLLAALVPLSVAVAISLLFRVLLMLAEFVWALVFAALTGGIRRITPKDY